MKRYPKGFKCGNKMKRTNKLLVALVALALSFAILALIPTEKVSAEGEVLVNGLYYTLDGTEATVVANPEQPTGSYSGSVTIPATITYENNQYSVVAIGDAAFNVSTNLTSVTIGANVKSIGANAFNSCSNLGTVTLPSGMTILGTSAFKDCQSLTSITLPNTLTTIGTSAFYHSGLLFIEVPASVTTIGENAFYTSSIESAVFNGTVTIGQRAFAACPNLEELTFKGGMTCAANSFRENVAGDSPIETIRVQNTTNNTVTFPDNVFCNSESLQTIELSGTVVIEKGAFFNASVQTLTVADDSAITINDNDGTDGAFQSSGLTSITLGDGVVATLGGAAFYNCTELISIDIGSAESVTIGASTFAYCDKLASVTVTENVTAVGAKAFRNSLLLTSVIIEDNANRIWGTDVFNDDTVHKTPSVLTEEELAANTIPQRKDPNNGDKWTPVTMLGMSYARINSLTIKGNSGIINGAFENIAFADSTSITIVGDEVYDVSYLLSLINAGSLTGLVTVADETELSKVLTLNGTLDLTGKKLVIAEGGKLKVSSSGKVIGEGTISFGGVPDNAEVIDLATGATMTVILDGGSDTADSKLTLRGIVAGINGVKILKGSVYINGELRAPDANGKIIVTAGDVKITGVVDEGVTLEIPAGMSVEVPTGKELVFASGSKLDKEGDINVQAAGSAVIYEKGSEVNGAVIEVTTKETKDGIEVTIKIYLVSENPNKLQINGPEYVEVFSGDSYADALMGITVTPKMKFVSFDGWYLTANNEKISLSQTVVDYDHSLKACFTEERIVPVDPDVPSDDDIVDDRSSFDIGLPLAFICLIASITVLGMVIVKKRK